VTGTFRIKENGKVLLSFEEPLLEKGKIIAVVQEWSETAKTGSKLVIECELEK
jgi:hypothetical protein